CTGATPRNRRRIGGTIRLPDADEDDDEYSEDPTPERRKWVAGVLGFDPMELEDVDAADAAPDKREADGGDETNESD
ncbi:MAG: hypothetical protein ACREHD_24290, partial [Pirellulales bacterium]